MRDNLIGQKFGRLTVKKFYAIGKDRKSYWTCKWEKSNSGKLKTGTVAVLIG